MKPIEQQVELNVHSEQLTKSFELLYAKLSQANQALRNGALDTSKSAAQLNAEISKNLKIIAKTKAELKVLGADIEAANKKALADQKKALEAQQALTEKAYKARAEAARAEGQSAREWHKEKSRLARIEAAEQKKLASEVAAYEALQHRRRLAEARELANARRESVRAKGGALAGSFTDVNAAKLQRAEIDQNLRRLRILRETQASTDAEAARATAARIEDQKRLGREIDATIRKLEAQKKATEARIAGGARLLAPEQVRVTAASLGSAAAALQFYQAEQRAARETLQLTLANKNATAEQISLAQEKLRLINAQVTAARALARAETTTANQQRTTNQQAQLRLAAAYAQQQIAALGPTKALAEAVAKTAAAQERLANASALSQKSRLRELELAQRQQKEIERSLAAKEKEGRPGALGSILSPGYAGAAFARTTVYGAAASAVYGISSTVSSSVSSLITLEDELAKLQAISGATDTQMRQLTASIFEIGAGSRYSLNDLARISQTLAQAGISASQMTDVLRSVTTLATASGSTPDEAVNLVTSAIGSFQLHTSEATRVADLMTSALNRTKLTVQQTAQAIQYVGATAYEQNISLEQLLATVGGIAQAGVRSGSTIGTGFRQFLVDLQTPSDKLREQLTLLNITAADVDVTTRGLPAVLDTLREKGFGAAQAYQGLETRAAAFYLVAKNNVDVMDNLQLAFANTNVAAEANEKAMRSVTAQWERFKNNLTIEIEDSFTPWSRRLSDSLDRVSDYFEESEQQAKRLHAEIAAGKPELEAYMEVYGNWGGTAEYMNEKLSFLTDGYLTSMAALYDYAAGLDDTTAASEIAATAVAETTEAVDNQAARMTELDKEIQRLIVQKKDLRDNDARSAAEMVTLMQRFEGLSAHLISTGNRYDDLTAAVRRYRIEQLAVMNMRLDEQGIAMGLQSAQLGQARDRDIAVLRDSPQYSALLSKQAQAALKTLSSAAPGSAEAQIATARLADEARGLLRGGKSSSQSQLQVAELLQRVVGNTATIGQNTAILGTIDRRSSDNRVEGTTYQGGYVVEALTRVNASMTQLQSASADERAALKASTSGQLQNLEAVLALAGAKPGMTRNERLWIAEKKQEVATLRAQLSAQTTAATAKETETAAKADRAAKRAEAAGKPKPKRKPRAAAVGKLVTQQDVDRVGRDMGLPLGSGVRSAAEQWALYRRGVTPATPDKSQHSNGGMARDFGVAHLSDAEAVAMAERMRARYKAMGIDAQVLYERGTKKGGKPDGTGRHIHVGVKKGSRFKAGQDAGDGAYDGSSASEIRAQEQEAERKRKAKAAAELDILESDFDAKLRRMRENESQSGFGASVLAAKEAMVKLQSKMLDEAEIQLFESGVEIGSVEYQAGMAKAMDNMLKRTQEYQKAIADTIIGSAERQLQIAEDVFKEGMRPYDLRSKILDAQSSGLSSYSLRNKVPGFVGQLVDVRRSKADEESRRQELNLLGPRIEEQRKQLYLAIWNSKLTGTTEETEKDIRKLREELHGLMEDQALLEAELGAGGLLPTSLNEGLLQAIEAYRELNGLNNTFNENVLMNMSGGIENIHGGFTTMFTDIITGSRSALGAIGNFASGVANYMAQLAAQMLAQQAINGLFSLLGVALGGGMGGMGAGSSGFSALGSSAASGFSLGRFTGGPVQPSNIVYRKSGGEIANGSPAADSVHLKAAKGEWVIQKSSVDSVGPQFMARLNQHGSKALAGLQSMPKIDMKSRTETNVYVVPPTQKPSLKKDDVLIIMQEDMLNGSTGRLIQKIVRE